MIARRDAKGFFIGVAVTLAGMLFATSCFDLRRGEITRAFEAPIRKARSPLPGEDFPKGRVDTTRQVAPLFPIGSELYYAEKRLQKEGFMILVNTNGPDEGKSLGAFKDCGPWNFGYREGCVVILHFHWGQITQVEAFADNPQGS